MKIFMTLFFVAVFSFHVSADNSYEKAFTSVAATFQKHFNQSNADSIYQMFAPNMQAAFPTTKLKAFLSNVHEDKGDILNVGLPFISALNKGEVPLYFKSDTLDLSI